MAPPIEKERFKALVEMAQRSFDTPLLEVEARIIADSVTAGALPLPPPTEPRPRDSPRFFEMARDRR